MPFIFENSSKSSQQKIDFNPQAEYPPGIMEAVAEKLETKLHTWKPETSQRVRALVEEIIEMADDDALDLGRSRELEQEVMDILDAPATRSPGLGVVV